MRLKSITSNIEMATMITSKIFTLAENALCISKRKNNDNLNVTLNTLFRNVLIMYASDIYPKYL